MKELGRGLALLCLLAGCTPAAAPRDGGPGSDGGPRTDGGPGADGGGGAALPVNCLDPTHAHDSACVSPAIGGAVGTGPSLSMADGFPAIRSGFVDGARIVVAGQIARVTAATNEGAILAVDLATGNRTLISGQLPHVGGGADSQGTGPDFTGGLRDVALGPDGMYAIAPHTVFHVDPATGNRTMVWNETTAPCDPGGGLTTSLLPESLAVGADGKVYVSLTAFGAGATTPSGIGAIHAGACTVLTFYGGPAGTDHGSGAAPPTGRFHALRIAGGALYATNDSSEALFRIDTTSGARTVVSTSAMPTTGAGPMLPTDWLDMSSDAHTAWLNSAGGGGNWQLTNVDVATGARTAYDYPSFGPTNMGQGGPVWIHPTRPLVIVGISAGLVLFDPVTKNSNVLSN